MPFPIKVDGSIPSFLTDPLTIAPCIAVDTVLGMTWILPSQRLPDKEVDVLTTLDTAYEGRIVSVAQHDGHGWGTWEMGRFPKCTVVVAWRPMPDPYADTP
jgi:hypothetical protein